MSAPNRGTTMDIREIADRLEIQEVLTRYAWGVDSKQFHLWRDVFTEDAVLDFSAVGYPAASRDEVIERFGAAMAHVPMTQHYVTNIAYEFDGDTAKVRAMFYNPMLIPGMADYSFCGGYYHHTFVRTARGWRSTHLYEENLWFANRPTKP